MAKSPQTQKRPNKSSLEIGNLRKVRATYGVATLRMTPADERRFLRDSSKYLKKALRENKMPVRAVLAGLSNKLLAKRAKLRRTQRIDVTIGRPVRIVYLHIDSPPEYKCLYVAHSVP